MTNLFATSAKPTIVLHKTSLIRSKCRLAFLGGIAQSLFVERSLLKFSFSTISEASQMRPSLLDEVEVEVLQEGLVGATMIGIDDDLSIIS